MIANLLAVTALLMPWLLGYAVVRPFFKQRYGYRCLALGVGYVVGWSLLAMLMRLYTYVERHFDTIELLVIQAAIALPLLFFLSAKRCTIEELRLEKAPSNTAYFLTLLLALLIAYRIALMGVTLIHQAPVAWSAWITEVVVPADAPLHGAFAIEHLDAQLGRADWLALQQIYTAMAFKDWGQSLTQLLMVSGALAMACALFGGLRYLGASLLPAIVSAYAVMSLPLLNLDMIAGHYNHLWVALLILSMALLAVNCLTYVEWRLVAPLMILLAAAFMSSKVALVFFVGLLLVVVWRVLGGFVGLSLLAFAAFALYTRDWLHLAQFTHLQPATSAAFVEADYMQLKQLLITQWLILDNWHFAALVCAGSLLFLLLSRKNPLMPQFMWLLVTVLVALLTASALVLSAGTLETASWVALINHTALYFMPLVMLLPVSVYQLIQRDEESLPTI